MEISTIHPQVFRPTLIVAPYEQTHISWKGWSQYAISQIFLTNAVWCLSDCCPLTGQGAQKIQ